MKMEYYFIKVLSILSCLFLATALQAKNETEQITEYEMLMMIQAEEAAEIDTGYIVSLENLDDLPTDQVTNAFDYINYGGGAEVIDPRTGLFKSTRMDLLMPPNTWQGPYVTYQPGRISLTSSYDLGTPLDLWGMPYYLFSPMGLVRPGTLSVTQELYGDHFDRYAIVSLGSDIDRKSVV